MPTAVVVLQRETYLHLDDALARVGSADDPICINLNPEHARLISEAFGRALEALSG